MSEAAPRSARAVATEALRRFDPARDYAATVLEPLLDRTDERQRATDLVFGTVRNLFAIDAVIAHFSGRPIERIARPLLSVIRPPVYELVYTPTAPVYSIVNEAANASKEFGGPKQTAFVNAVLRAIVRHIVDREADLATAHPRRTLVHGSKTGCAFDTDFLPDPDKAPAAYLSTCFSLPTWLVTGWLEDLGTERARAVCLGSNRRPGLYVRVNALKATAEALLERLHQAEIQAEQAPAPADDMLRLKSPRSVTQLPGFSEGLLTVQDPSASRAVRLLQPQRDWTILDMCAAPGTKTTQLAEATGDAARIVATDVDADRLERVRENVTRLGLGNVTVVAFHRLAQDTPGPYDAVMLDVPCSNTGVLAKRIEVRFRITPKSLAALAQTQSQLLERAAGLLQPGGTICYSTCSIQSQENQQVVQAFLSRQPHFALVREEVTLPSVEPFDHDGAYVAVLRSRS
jgi:16S rRNA (cytosine967-C5)-methyltransferase